MAVNAKGALRCLVEEAAILGVRLDVTHVVFTRPADTSVVRLRVQEVERWLSDPDRKGHFDQDIVLAPFMAGPGSTDRLDFIFTNANTAMEFRLRFS